MDDRVDDRVVWSVRAGNGVDRREVAKELAVDGCSKNACGDAVEGVFTPLMLTENNFFESLRAVLAAPFALGVAFLFER